MPMSMRADIEGQNSFGKAQGSDMQPLPALIMHGVTATMGHFLYPMGLFSYLKKTITIAFFAC